MTKLPAIAAAIVMLAWALFSAALAREAADPAPAQVSELPVGASATHRTEPLQAMTERLERDFNRPAPTLSSYHEHVNEVRPEQIFPPRAGRPTRRIIDVRAPREVAAGALPGALSLPILTDDERDAVGLRYAREGQDAAIEEGRILTQAAMPGRVRAWREAAADKPSVFMCWRGGLRSELAQRFTAPPWVPCVAGGYKALRAYLTRSLEPSLARRTAWVVSGPTGSGKTELLHAAASLPSLLALDLEGAAAHRGSAFGGDGPQPAQATFEHRLALPLQLGCEQTVVMEDESSSVGRLHLPKAVYDVLQRAPLLVVEDDLDARMRRIHRDYALAPARRNGRAATLAALTASVRRLRQRLGARPTEHMVAVLEDAHAQGAWEEPEAFRDVIEPLLRNYYDPLYRKAELAHNRTVLATGTRQELLAWLEERTLNSCRPGFPAAPATRQWSS